MRRSSSEKDSKEGSQTTVSRSNSNKSVGEVPRHPKWCPDCLRRGQRSKVKIFNLNENKEAIFMCSNMQVRKTFIPNYISTPLKINN